MNTVDRLRSDRYLGFVAALGALVMAALGAIAVAWKGLADSDVITTQLAYAASGALGGLALLGFTLGLGSIQATRRSEARERGEMQRVVTAAAEVLEAVRATAP